VYAQFTAMPHEELAGDPQAMAIGERLFMNNCAQCHGSDARGSKGFPNLTTRTGCTAARPSGSRRPSPRAARHDAADGRGRRHAEDVKNVANYVLSCRAARTTRCAPSLGKSKFSACAACHGVDGKGNPALGAPNLADDTWLHGYGQQAIVAMINNGKTNVMPAQQGKLTEAQIHVLASYVWGLSNRGAAP
jgi:cytochrome c oxidase cbb3-type subunit 3